MSWNLRAKVEKLFKPLTPKTEEEREESKNDDVIKAVKVPNTCYQQNMVTTSHHTTCLKCEKFLEGYDVEYNYLVNKNDVLYAYCEECMDNIPINRLIEYGDTYYADRHERLKPMMERVNKIMAENRKKMKRSKWVFKNW